MLVSVNYLNHIGVLFIFLAHLAHMSTDNTTDHITVYPSLSVEKRGREAKCRKTGYGP